MGSIQVHSAELNATSIRPYITFTFDSSSHVDTGSKASSPSVPTEIMAKEMLKQNLSYRVRLLSSLA